LELQKNKTIIAKITYSGMEKKKNYSERVRKLLTMELIGVYIYLKMMLCICPDGTRGSRAITS
jgi:predicted transcriptional regulator YheO